jgi:hypothetical protein
MPALTLEGRQQQVVALPAGLGGLQHRSGRSKLDGVTCMADTVTRLCCLQPPNIDADGSCKNAAVSTAHTIPLAQLSADQFSKRGGTGAWAVVLAEDTAEYICFGCSLQAEQSSRTRQEQAGYGTAGVVMPHLVGFQCRASPAVPHPQVPHQQLPEQP